MNGITFTCEEVQQMMTDAFIKGEIRGASGSIWATISEDEKSDIAADDCTQIFMNALISKM